MMAHSGHSTNQPVPRAHIASSFGFIE